MPVEIRELVIKASVEPSSAPGAPGPGNSNVSSSEEIIKACVEKVLEIIKEKTER